MKSSFACKGYKLKGMVIMREKKFLCILLIIILALSVGCSNGTGKKTIDTAEPIELDRSAIIPGSDDFSLCSDNEYMSLYVQASSGAFYVVDKANQISWHSNPPGVEDNEDIKGLRKTNLQSQLLISYVGSNNNEENTNSHAGSRIKQGVRVASRENGFRACYDFKDLQIQIAIDVFLDGDRLRVEIPEDQILELGDYKLYSLAPYPFFGAGAESDEGYILVPDGSGALIDFNNKKQGLLEYSQRIYGPDPTFTVTRQSRVTQQAYLPVLGIKRNNSGFMALIEKGAEYANCHAFVSGHRGPYNGGYFSFQLRYTYSYSLDGVNDLRIYDKEDRVCSDISLSYFLLKDEKSDYNGMADRLRQYLVDSGLVEKKDLDTSLALDVIASTTESKYLLGFEKRSRLNLTSYDQLKEMIEDLGSEGIDSLIIQYQQASQDSQKGRVTKTLKGAKGLGSKDEWTSLLALKDALVAPHVSFTRFSKAGNGVSKFFDASRSLSNALAKQQKHKLSTYYPDKDAKVSYLLSPKKVKELTDTFVSSLDKEPLALSLGDMGATLYSDYRKSDRYSRTDSLEANLDSLEALDKLAGKLIAEGANMYALGYLDHIMSLPVASSRFSIVDREVPFYQLVLSGLIAYSSPSINLEASPEIAFLKLLETGSIPQFTLYGHEDIDIIYTDTPEYLSSSYKDTKARIKAIYDEYSKALERLGSRELVSHKYLQDKVVEASYKGGASVIINYSDKNFRDSRVEVPAMGYKILGGEE